MPGTTPAKTRKKDTTSSSPLSEAKPKKPRTQKQLDNPGGRPPKLIPDENTIKEINGLGKLQCTNIEAAAFLEVSRETFEQFLGRNKNASEAFERGKEQGKASLRRAQFKAALAGNPTMLVWMGKQLLGQKDKMAIGGDNDAPPIAHTHTHVRDVISSKLSRIAATSPKGGMAGESDT